MDLNETNQNGIYPPRVERGFNWERTPVTFKSTGNGLVVKLDGGEKTSL